MNREGYLCLAGKGPGSGAGHRGVALEMKPVEDKEDTQGQFGLCHMHGQTDVRSEVNSSGASEG